MEQLDYVQLYQSLGIDIPTLDSSYNPDVYGKRLMSEYQIFRDVTYSANTNISNNLIDKERDDTIKIGVSQKVDT